MISPEEPEEDRSKLFLPDPKDWYHPIKLGKTNKVGNLEYNEDPDRLIGQVGPKPDVLDYVPTEPEDNYLFDYTGGKTYDSKIGTQ